MAVHREFDLILYGATGFTGRQAAAYLSHHAPPSLRWAIAGRDQEKLKELRLTVPILLADATNTEQLRDLAQRTCVVLTTAGPFRRYGDLLVAACVEAETDYCDISGETARIRDLVDCYHAAAEAKRLRIVPFCGVSSVPPDIAVFLLDQQMHGQLLTAKAALSLKGGVFNGGTVASTIDGIESGDAVRQLDPFLLGPESRKPSSLERDPRAMRYDGDLHAWVVPSPLAQSDTRAVRRSNVLLARDIRVQEYIAYSGVTALPRALGVWAVLALMNLAYRFSWSRRLLARMVKPGQGPSEKRMASGSYKLRLWGVSREGHRAELTVSGKGDAGNRITVLCACESALALALNKDFPERYGVLTPSTALGNVLADRLEGAGMEIAASSQR